MHVNKKYNSTTHGSKGENQTIKQCLKGKGHWFYKLENKMQTKPEKKFNLPRKMTIIFKFIFGAFWRTPLQSSNFRVKTRTIQSSNLQHLEISQNILVQIFAKKFSYRNIFFTPEEGSKRMSQSLLLY